MRHLSVAVSHTSPVVSAGLMRLFSQMRDYSLTASYVSVDLLSRYIAEQQPDIVVLDPLTFGTTPGRVIAGDVEKRPLLIGVAVTQLPDIFNEVYDGILSIYDAPSAYSAMIDRCVSADESSDPQIELSPRERDVVIGVVKGLSNKEIAAEMNVSTNTVMTHRRNIASKLQIHSVAGLTIYAIVSKLVRLEDLHQS